MSKKSFKIILTSSLTTSFSGNEFDATYAIDLTRFIRDTNDYKKSYYKLLFFRSYFLWLTS